MDGAPVVQLERERKIITDTFKMVAYRAETQLANLVGPLLPHRDDEARKFMRQVFELPADLLPDYARGTLTVRLHSNGHAATQSRPRFAVRRSQRPGRMLPRHRTPAGSGGPAAGARVAIIIGACPGLCNEVWTWDCSKLPTRARSVYLTLYVVLDLFSRFVLAWMVSGKENSALAQQLMAEATARYRIAPGQLTIHQDRGAPMTAHRYIDVLSEMDVVLSHSRPRVSNDNAFSEAQFKTQKYQPDYPGRFDHAAHARSWCGTYFDWYNFEHHHSGLAGYTPEQVFTGRHREVASGQTARPTGLLRPTSTALCRRPTDRCAPANTCHHQSGDTRADCRRR